MTIAIDEHMFEREHVYIRYIRLVRRKWLISLVLCAVLAATALVALSTGSSALGLADLYPALTDSGHPAHAIVTQLRLPRIVMAILVGFGLSLAGVVFQAILRNPLASPYTLGIGSSAGFGAVLPIFFLPAAAGRDVWIAASAFLFTMISAFVVLAVSRLRNAGSETMILTGIALMFLFSALTSFFQYMGTMEQVSEIVFWFFGSLSKAGWMEIPVSAIMILTPFPFILRMAPDFNLLATGDDAAKGLGVNVERVRMAALILASFVTAGAICFTGVIGFVGLVAPHITRMLLGSDHRFLLPASAMSGAVLVLAADTLGRTVWAPQVIPLGIVTAFTGVPFFFYLLVRRTKETW
ncbi:MAG: iron ABC transporter permease [Desulfobacteraceae bacterium]|jgi:iron complex transport system permease protein